MNVYVVDVAGREDGLYAFIDADGAQRFADAVREQGGDCTLAPLPLCNSATADQLAAIERDPEHSEDPTPWSPR